VPAEHIDADHVRNDAERPVYGNSCSDQDSELLGKARQILLITTSFTTGTRSNCRVDPVACRRLLHQSLTAQTEAPQQEKENQKSCMTSLRQ
jgi:hypothetical protein